MIPDWNNPHKIALVLEAKVGKGSLLMSAVDLRNDMAQRPVARQFLHSLESYVSSEDFAPSEVLTIDAVDKIFGKE